MPRIKHIAKKQKKSKYVGPSCAHQNKLRGPNGEEKTKVCPSFYLKVSDFQHLDLFQYLDFQECVGFISCEMDIDFALVDYFCRHVKMNVVLPWEWDFSLKLVNGDKFTYDLDDFREDFGIDETYPRLEAFFDNVTTNYDLEWSPWMKEAGYEDREALVRRLNHLDEYEEITPEMTKGVNTKFLSGDDKILLLVVRKILYQTNNKDDEVSLKSAMLLGLLKENVKINFPFIIATTLYASLENAHNDSYPYGGLITKIMRKWGIIVSGGSSKAITKATPVTKTTYRLQKSELVGTRLVNRCEFPYISKDLQRAYMKEWNDRPHRPSKNAPKISSDNEEQQGGNEIEMDTNEDDSLTSGNGNDNENDSDNMREEIRSKKARDRNNGLQGEVARIHTELGELRGEVEALRTEQRSMMSFLKKIATKLGCTSPSRDDVHDPSSS